MKKQSDANYGNKPPESITFFLDRALGKHTVSERLILEGKKLKEIEITIRHLEDFPNFNQSTPDEEWLEFAGEKSFVVLTKDNESVCFDQWKLVRRTDGRDFRQGFKTYVQLPQEKPWTFHSYRIEIR